MSGPGQIGIHGPTWNGSGGYTLQVHASVTDPADGFTYYFGNQVRNLTNGATFNKIYIRKAGRINIAELIVSIFGGLGTNEAVSIYVRLNNTTDYLIGAGSFDAVERVFSNTALGVPLIIGDYVEIKVVCPVWVTNPTTVYIAGYLLVE